MVLFRAYYYAFVLFPHPNPVRGFKLEDNSNCLPSENPCLFWPKRWFRQTYGTRSEMPHVIRCYFVSFLKKRAAEFQQCVRAHWINDFDSFPPCKRGIISGSTEIVPGALCYVSGNSYSMSSAWLSEYFFLNAHPGWDRARCQEYHLKVYVTFLKEVSFEKVSRLFIEVHPKNVEIIDWENFRKTVINVVLGIKKKLNDISPWGK